jgi:resuscitation-promoting factor RpfA
MTHGRHHRSTGGGAVRAAARAGAVVAATTGPLALLAGAAHAAPDPAAQNPRTWDRIAQCETTGNWDADTGNGYQGGLQFDQTTWKRHGGTKYAPSADRASKQEQIAVAKKVQASQGWDAWPSCSQKAGVA